MGYLNLRNYIGLLSTGVLMMILFSCNQENNGPQNRNRPNILLITAHDLGQHIGAYGVETVKTPNLDRLAAKGIRFKNFYSTSGVCTPGRASLLTGTYPQTNGLMGLTHAPWWWEMNDDIQHVAQMLKPYDYNTLLIGLQHVTQGPVEELGYDQHLSENRNAEETVEASLDLFNETSDSEDPFFAKVGFTQVHRDFPHGVDSSRGVFIPAYLQDQSYIRDDLAAFQAEINYMDRKIGEILQGLEANEQLAENTIVIFTSEHGIPFPGAKWTARKAGIENPFIIYQPNSVFSGGEVYESIMSNVDVLPTLLDFIDVPIPAQVEGKSFYPFINGTAEESPRKFAFSQYTPDMKRDNLSRGVITEDYHLIRYFDQGRSVDYPTDAHPVKFAGHIERMKTKGTRPFAQLYDIRQDPYELNNIGGDKENKPVVDSLSTGLKNWMQRVDDQLLKGPLKTPYYERAMEDF